MHTCPYGFEHARVLCTHKPPHAPAYLHAYKCVFHAHNTCTCTGIEGLKLDLGRNGIGVAGVSALISAMLEDAGALACLGLESNLLDNQDVVDLLRECEGRAGVEGRAGAAGAGGGGAEWLRWAGQINLKNNALGRDEPGRAALLAAAQRWGGVLDILI